MIINHANRWIYIGPPKTGSTTMHRVLQTSRFGGRQLTVGVQHDTDIPIPFRDYFIWATVRDPYARAISLYWHYLRDMRRMRQPVVNRRVPVAELAKGGCTFADFLRQLCEKRMQIVAHDAAFYLLPVYGWLRVLPRIDGVVRLERLDAEFSLLPFGFRYEFPTYNQPGYPQDHSYLTPETIPLIEQWAGSDLQYGYRMLSEDF